MRVLSHRRATNRTTVLCVGARRAILGLITLPILYILAVRFGAVCMSDAVGSVRAVEAVLYWQRTGKIVSSATGSAIIPTAVTMFSTQHATGESSEQGSLSSHSPSCEYLHEFSASGAQWQTPLGRSTSSHACCVIATSQVSLIEAPVHQYQPHQSPTHSSSGITPTCCISNAN